MTTADLDRIEARLGLPLPPGYRAFLANYPADAPAEVRRYELFDAPAAVLDETAVFRRYLEAEDDDRWLVIGDSGCGDRICLDLTTERVAFWSHDAESFEHLAESVEEYYRLAVAELV